MRVTTTNLGFNAGELSPLLDARIDIDPYQRGCRTLLNYIPTTQGPATRRKGTRYVAEVKDSTKKVRLIEFIFSEIDSYVLEFGDTYIRFYQSQAQVQSGGSPYEVVSPYLETELFQIKYAQLGDIMYLTHPNHRPRKLSRLGATNWTLTAVDNLYGPVVDRNADEAVTMQASGTTGSVTITASAGTFGTDSLGFQASHVGSLWAFGEASDSLSAYSAWVAGGSSTANDFYRYEGRLYRAGSTGTFGTIPPIHEAGTVSDGTIDLTFWNKGVGYARMTARTSSTVATFSVQRNLPPTIETGSPLFAASTFWNEASWSGVRGYPRAVEFFEERLVFAGTNQDPLSEWFSRSNRRFEDFDPSEAEDDAAISVTLTGRVNTIQWLRSDGDFLVAGTYGGLGFTGAGSSSALSPTNIKARTGTKFGASSVQGELIENSIHYLQRAGRKLYRAAYDDIRLNYNAENLSVLAEHITEGGIVEMSIQEEPYNIVWMIRGDGILLSMTSEAEQKVKAWSRHQTGLRGDGTFDTFESVKVIPSTTNDEVWVVVKRQIGAGFKRYIEFIEPSDIEYFVDSGIIYSGAAATVISGLTHLDNVDVKILADGAVKATQAVTGGTVTLTTAAETVYAGIGFNSDLSPMLPEAGTRDGPAQGRIKRIHEINFRLYKTRSLKYGKDSSTLKSISFRTPAMAMSDPPDLFGSPRPKDKTEVFNGDWDEYAEVFLRVEDPVYCTVVSINPRLNTNE